MFILLQDNNMTVQSLFCVFLLFYLNHIFASQISLGSKLYARENSSWVSKNGDFAMKFLSSSDQSGMYSVGIHFNSKSIPISKQSVVWVAGGDVTVGEGSYLELSKDGELILVDSSKGEILWNSNTKQLGVETGVVGDNGNLVLLNGNKDIIWQSFDHPSDTLLPWQKLSVGKTLRAASRNSLSSYYSLHTNSAPSQLQLRWESNVTYWSSHPIFLSLSTNISAVFTTKGALQLVDNKHLKPYWSVYGEDGNDDSVQFRFLRLDVDGNLRMYSWVEDSESWISVWQAVENQCSVFATCGVHGNICHFNASGSPECQCLSKNATSLSSAGPNTKCYSPSTCPLGYSMVTSTHTSLYAIHSPNDDLITNTNLEKCRDVCMATHDCTATTFINNGSAQCLVKRTPYFSGYSEPSLSSVSFVKTCLESDFVSGTRTTGSSSSGQSPVSDKKFEGGGLRWQCIRQSPADKLQCGGRLSWEWIFASGSATTIILFLVVRLAIDYCTHRRNLIQEKVIALFYADHDWKGLKGLKYAEIKYITGGFKHEKETNIYEGVLPNNDRVIVKELDISIEKRMFGADVLKMGNIHHRNLVRLVGYCCDSDHRIIVHELPRKGSLQSCLQCEGYRESLTWKNRIEICTSVARALCYLHSGCKESLTHENLNCGNIYLDDNFEAKVSDYWFGLIHDHAGGLTTTTVSGGEKDVEDFGKVLLTVISRRTGQTSGGNWEWAYEEWRGGHRETVVDQSIIGEVDVDELERALRIAFWCLQQDPGRRPKMDEVVLVLEGTVTPDPPPPLFFTSPPAQE